LALEATWPVCRDAVLAAVAKATSGFTCMRVDETSGIHADRLDALYDASSGGAAIPQLQASP